MRIFYLFCLINLLNFPILYAQRIECIDETVDIPYFKCDSTTSYNNNFVRYDILNNIKNSNQQLEIRLYSFGSYNDEGTSIVLKYDGSKTTITNNHVYFRGSYFGPGLTPVYRDDRIIANMISSSKEILLNCKLIRSLIDNDLFTFQSSSKSEFKPINGVHPGMDAVGQYIVEVKVGDYIRNFQYLKTYGYEDTVINREKKINQIIQILTKLSK